MTAVLRRRAKTASSAGSGEKTAGSRPQPSGPRLLALMAVAVLVLAMGCLTLWTRQSKAEATQRARTDALAAAQSYVKDLLSYDYRSMEGDLKAAKSHMTPRMARAYDSYYHTTLIPAVQKTKAQALTQAQTGGVMHATPTTVEVVLFVKMISVNSVQKEPTVGAQRLKLEMKKSGGKWLINGPLLRGQTSTTPSAPTPSNAPSKSP